MNDAHESRRHRRKCAPLVWILEIVPTDLAAIFVPAPPASLHVNHEAIFGIVPFVYVVRSCGAVVAYREWLQQCRSQQATGSADAARPHSAGGR